MTWIPIVAACITALVTIIGFIITYHASKRNFRQELTKQKFNVQLSKLVDTPRALHSILHEMTKGKFTIDDRDGLDAIVGDVFAYGSRDAIALLTKMMENLRNNEYREECQTKWENEVMSNLVLLLCQVKYDLTGVELNVYQWIRSNMADDEDRKNELYATSIEIAKQLGILNFYDN